MLKKNNFKHISYYYHVIMALVDDNLDLRLKFSGTHMYIPYEKDLYTVYIAKGSNLACYGWQDQLYEPVCK